MSRVLGRLLVLLAVVPVSIGATWAPFAEHLHQPQSLTFEDRVAAQRAIEEVYWRHRIWPKENPSPKPSLDAMMPESAIRTKVEDYLKKSNALEKWWQRPITGAQLQAELGRMARDTHDPRVLRELFDALRGDALVLAETLARQVLADRLARSWYASDERFHGEARRRADAAFAACRDAQCLKAMGGVYSETTWKLEDGETGDLRAAADNAPSSFDARTWSLRLERLAAAFDARPDSLPIRTWSRPKETTGAFVMNAVLSQREGEIVMATTAWPRRSFDDWWKAERVAIGTAVRTAEDRFTLPRVDLVACAGDTWTPTYHDAPDPRSEHSAVWTGTEMIVWGGSLSNGATDVNSGGRYDPATDTWTATSMGAGVPDPRRAHTAVWTGTEMIVWGGYGNQGTLNMERGGRYDPGTNTWTATSTAGIPPLRVFHSSVWTGMDMIVWGGEPPTSVGGRYCACPEGRIAYRDADGDGYGAAGVSIPSCDGSIPAGYVDDSTDCNDANAAVHRGAVEVCNGVDDNCNGLVDEDTNGEDSDGDLIHNLCDNWPFNYNPTQSDTDHDGQGDVCDLDDGLIWEWRNDRASVSWQAEQGPKAWDVYIGDLDVLKKTGVYTQAPGSNALADRHCGEAQTFADDLGVPAAGKVSFSLVTGVTNGVEGSLGSSSSGARPNANPCP